MQANRLFNKRVKFEFCKKSLENLSTCNFPSNLWSELHTYKEDSNLNYSKNFSPIINLFYIHKISN